MSVYIERQVQTLKDSMVNTEDGNDYNGLRRLIIKRNLVITLAISALVCRCRSCISDAETEIEAYKAELAKKYNSGDPELELIQDLLNRRITESTLRLIPDDSETREISKRVEAYTAHQKGDLKAA